MDLTQRPIRLASLLASLAVLWALFRRLSTQRHSRAARAGQEPTPTEALAGATAPAVAVGAAPEAEEGGEGRVPVGAVAGAAVGTTEPPKFLPSAAEEEARAIAEDPRLEQLVQAVVQLHGRKRLNLELVASVQTAYVPDLSDALQEFVVPKVFAFCLLTILQAFGLACLGSSVSVGLGATLSVVGICVVALSSVTVLASVDTRRTCRSADAVCAVATVRHHAVDALWRMVVAWVAAKPGRGVAWRDGLAFLVEVEEGALSEEALPPTRYGGFVLEKGPLRVHHYLVRPHNSSACAPEVSWSLREFLGQVKSGGDVIAEVGSQHGIVGGKACAPRTYRKARLILSQQDTAFRLTELPPLLLLNGGPTAGGAQEPSVFVNPASRMPKPWLGFGGGFTESSATILAKMPAELAEQVLQAYFNPQWGLGYTLGRLPMGSCDFGLGYWTCGDLKPEDHELGDFSIEHYHQEILPMCYRAAGIAGAPLWMLASPWSPPLWMKTKKEGDGHLRPECAQAWALHFVCFVQQMAKVGIHIGAVTVQNEPEEPWRAWQACMYTATEERDFIRDHLGPTMWASGLESVKILIWDHNRDGMFERASVAYSDPEAAKYIWGCAYHWYGDAHYEAWPERSEVGHPDPQRGWSTVFKVKSRLCLDNLQRVAELRPEKHILLSESCQELAGFPVGPILHHWKFGERYAMNIIADMNNGCEGWIDRNLLLDEVGGPNIAGHFCVSPVVYNASNQEVIYAPPYYFLGHFSKFIHPGAKRVLCSSSRDALEVTAFANPDESIAVVVLNQSNGALDFKLKVGGEEAAPMQVVPVRSPPNSIMTLVLE